MSSPVPRLDAHQHFWAYDAAQYPWIEPGSPLQRDWLPADLQREQAKVGFAGSIAVQARQTLEESRWLLTLADHAPSIRGVVGWVDLRAENVGHDLTILSQHPRFLGVRHVVQDEPDPNFMLQPEFLRGLGLLARHKLTYDILIYPAQLPAAIEVVRKLPEQPFVLDHIAKPPIKEHGLSPWREQIRELAKAPNLHCKVSGMVTEADLAHWKPADFVPYLEIIFEAFGAERLMFGSDWPVCLRAASYEQVFHLVDDFTRSLSEEARAGLFGGNAAKFYRVPA